MHDLCLRFTLILENTDNNYHLLVNTQLLIKTIEKINQLSKENLCTESEKNHLQISNNLFCGVLIKIYDKFSTQDKVQALKEREIRSLRGTIETLTPEQIRWFTPQQMQWFELESFTDLQIGEFTLEQVQALTTEQLHNSAEHLIKNLHGKKLEWFTEEQISSFDKSAISALVNKLSYENYFGSFFGNYLENDVFKECEKTSKFLLKRFSTTQVNFFLDSILKQDNNYWGPILAKYLSPLQVSCLYPWHLIKLGKHFIANMNVQKFQALNSTHLQFITVDDIEDVKDDIIHSIDVNLFPDKLIEYFIKKQILTKAQIRTLIKIEDVIHHFSLKQFVLLTSEQVHPLNIASIPLKKWNLQRVKNKHLKSLNPLQRKSILAKIDNIKTSMSQTEDDEIQIETTQIKPPLKYKYKPQKPCTKNILTRLKKNTPIKSTVFGVLTGSIKGGFVGAAGGPSGIVIGATIGGTFGGASALLVEGFSAIGGGSSFKIFKESVRKTIKYMKEKEEGHENQMEPSDQESYNNTLYPLSKNEGPYPRDIPEI
jgi:hypothetical protein